VSVVRIHANGKISYDATNDFVDTKPYCDDPVMAVVQPIVTNGYEDPRIDKNIQP
jgi:hypothetical protein